MNVPIREALSGPPRDSLDLFLAYEVASGEGFNVFGLDAFNDAIATEAGAFLGEALQGDPAAGIAPLVIDSKATLEKELEKVILQARKDLLKHPLFSPAPAIRDRLITAFLSVQYAHNGTNFVPVDAHKFPSSEGSPHVWKSTLGIMLDKNKAILKDPVKVKKFVEAVDEHLRLGGLAALPAAKGTLTALDVEALHQMIEMLSLIGEGRSGAGKPTKPKLVVRVVPNPLRVSKDNSTLGTLSVHNADGTPLPGTVVTLGGHDRTIAAVGPTRVTLTGNRTIINLNVFGFKRGTTMATIVATFGAQTATTQLEVTVE